MEGCRQWQLRQEGKEKFRGIGGVGDAPAGMELCLTSQGFVEMYRYIWQAAGKDLEVRRAAGVGDRMRLRDRFSCPPAPFLPQPSRDSMSRQLSFIDAITSCLSKPSMSRSTLVSVSPSFMGQVIWQDLRFTGCITNDSPPEGEERMIVNEDRISVGFSIHSDVGGFDLLAQVTFTHTRWIFKVVINVFQ